MEHQHEHHQETPGVPVPHKEQVPAGHDKHAGHSVNDFWKRFLVSSIVSIPILALSHMLHP